jgi:hypothetical protein
MPVITEIWAVGPLRTPAVRLVGSAAPAVNRKGLVYRPVRLAAAVFLLAAMVGADLVLPRQTVAGTAATACCALPFINSDSTLRQEVNIEHLG